MLLAPSGGCAGPRSRLLVGDFARGLDQDGKLLVNGPPVRLAEVVALVVDEAVELPD